MKTKRLHTYSILIILFLNFLMVSFAAGDAEANMNSIKNEEVRFSLTVINKALSEVFESISKQTGYMIIYNEEWGSFLISIVLADVALDTGLEKILKSHEISYFITYNYNDKEIVIDIADGNNAKRQKRKAKIKVNKMDERVHVNIENIPINKDDSDEIPPWEMIENRSEDGEIEFLDVELVPPDDSEESGITPRELMEMRKDEKEVDFTDTELVPPDDY